MNSGAVVQAPTGTASCYFVRAYVNWDGTGTSGVAQSIRASAGVTSVTKFGTSGFTVALSTAMPSAEYATILAVQNSNEDAASDSMSIWSGDTPTTSQFQTASARPAWVNTGMARQYAIVII